MFTCRLPRLATPHIHLSALHHPQQQIQPHNQPRKHPGPHQTHHHQALLESSCVVYTCTTPPTAGCEALNPGQANRPRAKKKVDTQKRLLPFKSSFTHFFHMRRRRGGSRYYVHVCCCPAQMARSSPVAALRRGGLSSMFLWHPDNSLWRSGQTPWRPEMRWCVLGRGGHNLSSLDRCQNLVQGVWDEKGRRQTLVIICHIQSLRLKAPSFGG